MGGQLILDNKEGQNEHLSEVYYSLFNENPDAICMLDEEANILNANTAFVKLLNVKLSELENQHILTIIEPAQHDEVLASLLDRNMEYRDFRFNVVNKDNEKIGCLMKLVPISSEGMRKGHFLVMKDMRELDKIAQNYIKSELNYRIISENVQDVIILMDSDKNYLYVSPSSKEMFGFDYKDIDKIQPFINIHPDDATELDINFDKAILTGKTFKMTLKAWHDTRGWIWTEMSGKPVFDDEGNFRHMLFIARDISHEKESEEQLRYFAYHDVLTGLPNRRLFMDSFGDLLQQLEEKGQSFAVMILDIDNFKVINDEYGHDFGDAVITEFGKRLQQSIGDLGIAARQGGDEFTVLIHEVKEQEQVAQIAQLIQQSMSAPLIIQQVEVLITTSIGFTICVHPQLTHGEVMKSADAALYKVKERGKNEYAFQPCY